MKLKRSNFGLYIVLAGICISLASFHPCASTNNHITPQEILKNIFAAVSNIKTLRYNLQCNERIKGKMKHTESQVKLQINPRKIYLSLKGPELLWIQGENNGNALVNPGEFPYINLNLDPYGLLMRKDQHHTIHEMGIHYLADIMKDGLAKAGNDIDKHFVIQGEEIYNGHPCYRLSIAFSEFTWETYTVKKTETITSIARKLHVSEYMVLERNAHVNWYSDVKPGHVIQVPTVYAKLTMLLIDKESFLPLSNKVYDDKGLFETYEYVNLQVNPTIAPEEFTKGYKDYHF
jgi:outer membrane lipoprotein-sorting protein